MTGSFEVTWEEIKMDINNILLVDIRDSVSYQHGHIDGAISVPTGKYSEIAGLLRNYPGETKVVLYCGMGEMSREPVMHLRKAGVDAWNLYGGFRSWLLQYTDILDKEEVERYSRQILLPDIGREGQEKLKRAKVLVIGAGGLGSPILFYLASAGVGTIGIADGDCVNLTNLQRQIVHSVKDIGENKAVSAKRRLQSINPDVQIITYENYLTPDNIEHVICQYDFIIDGVDNFEGKFLINDACVIHKKPFCHAGILKFEGQVMTWLPGKGACYRCIFEEVPEEYIPNCAQAGVIGAVAGIIGSVQALEALKYIVGAGELLTGRMYVLDGLTMNSRIVKFGKKSETCKVCGGKHEIADIKQNKYRYMPRSCRV